MKIFRRLLVAIDGVVAVETALVVSVFLVPMLLCLLDFAQIYQGQADVDEALQDAMTYVMSAGSSATNAGVQTAAQASNGNSIAVSTSALCYCVSTVTTVPTMPTSVGCTSSCTGNFVFQQFMNIVTTNQVTIAFPVSSINLTSPFTVTATGLVRTG
ncbi:MAG: TadE/TadG family type IV pilus assembly protein [Roseiarcus sp.]|jgi:Flp pilus assembly protein TadG